MRPLLARHFVQHGMVRNAIHSIQNVLPAVRRAGVTVTIGTFERAGFIKNRRGIITILDFNMLEEVLLRMLPAHPRTGRGAPGLKSIVEGSFRRNRAFSYCRLATRSGAAD